jgi:non-specific serine/threonine protein kinase
MEREVPLTPLPVPDPTDMSSDEVVTNPALRLLVARAMAVEPRFSTTSKNSRELAEICVRLDGLPLALELAAAHLKVFTPAELVEQLSQRLTLLSGGPHDSPPRHQGLRTAISWSHDLMSEEERAFFRRLAVFVGGWTLAASEAVCADKAGHDLATDATVLTRSLVDKSIVRRSTRADGVTAFSMLESIREYAAEQLAECGELESTQRRHTEYYTRLANEAESGIGTNEENLWWTWLGFEHGNLRSALDQSLDGGDLSDALQLAAALGWYWYTRGYIGEGRVVVERTMSVVGDAVAPPDDTMAAALLAAGILAWAQGDLDVATSRLERSRTLSMKTTDRRRVAVASAFLGHTARDASDYELAAEHYAQAQSIYDQSGNARGTAWAKFDRALLEWRRADLDEASRLMAHSLGSFRELGYQWAIAWSAWALGCLDSGHGDVAAATAHAAESLAEFERTDDRRGIAQCLELTARIGHLRGLDETSGRLLGAADVMRQALVTPASIVERDMRNDTEGMVRQGLGEKRAMRAISAGRKLPTTSVHALAWRVLRVGAADDETATAWPTARERQVAALVAAGCTNREIGRMLGISEKTAEVHVRNIMGKLGARSRAEIAAWAVSHGIYAPEDERHDVST